MQTVTILVNQLRRLSSQRANTRKSSCQLVFDEALKIRHRNLAVLHAPDFHEVQYFRDELARRLVDRLYDVKRSFPVLLDLNGGLGHLTPLLEKEKVGKCVIMDPSHELLEAGKSYHQSKMASYLDPKDIEDPTLVERIPTRSFNDLSQVNSQYDAIVSYHSTHWVNDLEKLFQDIYNSLVEDGLFICAIIGGDTLFELRSSFLLASNQCALKESPGMPEVRVDLRGHISPMVQMQDLGNILSVVGFQLATLDYDEYKIYFPTLKHLLKDLYAAGECHAPFDPSMRASLTKGKLKLTEKFYLENFGERLRQEEVLVEAADVKEVENFSRHETSFQENATTPPQGGLVLPATIQVFFLIGWKPCATKTPQPILRGSAKRPLEAALQCDLK